VNLPLILLTLSIGYLWGSVSFARLVTRLVSPKQDFYNLVIEGINGEGRFESNAISATWVRLHLGNRYGCLVGILDILKSAFLAQLLKLWWPDTSYYLLAAGMVVVGHNWPIYYHFKGGRGSSPIVGGMLVVDWLGVIITNILGLMSDIVFRNMLLSSGVWLVLMIPWIWLGNHGWPERIYAVGMLIIYYTAMIPEIKEVIRLKREGLLDKLQGDTKVKVKSRLDVGVAQLHTVPGLLSEFFAKFKRKAGDR
jgi:glycerol-3-phosphate acyltransferase PlsY